MKIDVTCDVTSIKADLKVLPSVVEVLNNNNIEFLSYSQDNSENKLIQIAMQEYDCSDLDSIGLPDEAYNKLKSDMPEVVEICFYSEA